MKAEQPATVKGDFLHSLETMPRLHLLSMAMTPP
jgi:hypothetical protein